MWAGEVLKRALSARGVELVPRWRIPRAPQTAYLKRLLETLGIDCVLDVGANVGQFRDYLRLEVGYQGMIVSFEPHPDCFAACKAASEADDKWEVFALALGEVVGKTEFHLMKDSQFSSFLQPDNALAPHYEGSNQIERVVSVDVARLDDLLPDLLSRLACQRPFLKLDTQGFEAEVLRGAAKVQAIIPALQAEVSNVPIYRNIRGMEATLADMREAGWRLGCLFPTNPDQFPTCVDFDGYFLRAEAPQHLAPGPSGP